MEDISIYVHWPFCESKCPYCDFNSHVANKIVDYDDWKNAFRFELSSYLDDLEERRSLRSIFFGGGTPSLMDPSLVEMVINLAIRHKNIKILQSPEITLEANPSSMELRKFKSFKDAGINRLSIGVQAFNNDDLQFLGRKHDVRTAIRTIESAKKNFDNYSFDLIYARKNQSLKSWTKELKFAVNNFAKDHLSLYSLTIEKGTPFYSMHARNEFILPDSEPFCEATQELMAESGFERYEISNYARNGAECRHNLAYWHIHDYIGIGPGAHGRVGLNLYKNRNNSDSALLTPSAVMTKSFGRYITSNHCNPLKYLSQMKDAEKSGSIYYTDNSTKGTEVSSGFGGGAGGGGGSGVGGGAGLRNTSVDDSFGAVASDATPLGIVPFGGGAFGAKRPMARPPMGDSSDGGGSASFRDGGGGYGQTASGGVAENGISVVPPYPLRSNAESAKISAKANPVKGVRTRFPCQEFRKISEKEQIQEIFIMSLRSTGGFNLDDISRRLSFDLAKKLDWDKVRILAEQDMLQVSPNGDIKPTKRGMDVADSLASFLSP